MPQQHQYSNCSHLYSVLYCRAFHLKMLGERLIAHLKPVWRAILSKIYTPTLGMVKWWIVRDFDTLLAFAQSLMSTPEMTNSQKRVFQVFYL